MFNLAKKKKISFYLTVGLSAVFLLLIVWQLFFGNGSANEESTLISLNEESSLSMSVYQSAIARIANLQEAYKDDNFKDPLFIRLKSIFRLPLEIGQVGKDNPFLLPLPPEVQIPVR